MSLNQSKVEKSESHSRRPGRSGSSGNQRNYYGSGGGKGGGGTAHPPPSSSINSSSSTNRSYKKSSSGQDGQPRVNNPSAISESNVSAPRAVQNGAHVQPTLRGASDASVAGAVAKTTSSPLPKSSRPVLRAPSSQPPAGNSNLTEPATPVKDDESKAFPFQFGSISPGFMNGMQIPARTNSAPPNMDEQKRNQALHDSSKAVPALPIPAGPKQQQPRQDIGSFNRSNTGESNALSQPKRDVHAQGPAARSTSTQKPPVLPITGKSMPMPFQPQVSVPFGGPNPQIQSQGFTSTSMQMQMQMQMQMPMQMQMQLPVGNTTQVPQQVFVQSLQSHPLQQQGMMPQGQSLSYAPQIGHQMPPQLGSLGIGIGPQFSQQQAGKFGVPRRPVKITHPKTHEELRLDKRTDPNLDGGLLGSRLLPNVMNQSQPIPSFTPTHQIGFYSHMQPNTYNPNPIFFQTQAAAPSTSTQMTTGSQPLRYNYPSGQGPQNLSFMNPSTINPSPVAKNGPLLHGFTESLNSELAHDGRSVVGSAPSVSTQVAVKPMGVSLTEKVGSSATVSLPDASKGESPKLLRPPQESRTFHPPKDSEICSERTVQLLNSVSEPSASVPSSIADKHSATVSSTDSGLRLPPNTSSSTLSDYQKKLSRKDMQHYQSPHQEDASDSAGSSKSSSLKIAREVSKQPENNMQPPPLGVVGPSMSISGLPDHGSEHSSTLKYGNSEVVGGASCASSVSSGGFLESAGKSIPDNCAAPDASEMVGSGVQIGELSTCELLTESGVELVGAVSGCLDTVCHAKKDTSTLLEVQLKQEIMETVEPRKIEPSEGSKRGGRNSDMHVDPISLKPVEGNKQTEQNSNMKEITIGSVSGSMETDRETNEAMGLVEGTSGNLYDFIRSATTSSDSIEAETTSSSYVSTTISRDDKASTVDASTIRNERADSQDVSVLESGLSHQDSVPLPTPVSSEISWKIEEKGTETTSCIPGSTSVPDSKDKPTLEANKVKTTNAKLKKKRKDVLKAADAAGSTSDLYVAYKGPEEKQEIGVSSESIDSSSSVDVKQEIVHDVEKVVVASGEDGQSKAEPDDWEVAADSSTPELKTSDNGKQVHGSLRHPDEDGSQITGRNKYSRDFLLTISDHCTDLPEGFEIGSDIAEALMSVQKNIGISHLFDRESYPNYGRSTDRPSGGPRPDRRGSGVVDEDKWIKPPGLFASVRDPHLDLAHGGSIVGFRPGQGGNYGVLRNPRGHPSGLFTGGILPGLMQSLPSQGGMQRNSPDADRWLRATGVQKGLIPSPQTPLQVMHKAEKKYERGKVSDQEEAKQRKLKAILNKLTPQNFEKLFEQVKEVNIDNGSTLTGVISQIFDKALMEPTFCEMYANFCYHLAAELPDFNEDNEKITFRRVLLNKCQEEFERGEREQAEANRVEEEGEIKQSEEEREDKKIKARRRMLGNIRLIGELYKKKMLTERIMHECINKLLGQYQNPDEEDVEALCKLMSTIGEMIDHQRAKVNMDAYFDMMTKMSNNMKLSSRVRFMLKDSIDLRKNKWQQRIKVEGPKKIDEVHRDAAQERQAQASRLVRGPNNNSSTRRGQPMDFGPRGSAVLSSTNAQIGSLRGLQSQVRGYAAVQDVRLDDRHRHESRTLSVPSSQRPIDDDSITLGPQGGLARGMSMRGQPLMSGVPLVAPSPGDSRRIAASPNGCNSASDWTHYNSREETMPRGIPVYEQSISHEHQAYFGNRDLRSADHSFDRYAKLSPAARVPGSPVALAQNVASEKVCPEERLRDRSITAIREFYSAKDEEEVALCIKELNSPDFYPSMISIWVTDSFERKDMDRDLLAKLLINLTKSQDRLLSEVQLIKGFESVLAALEDTVNDAPKAAEFLGGILAKIILENVISLREIGRLIREGGEEPGRLLQMGLASEVLASILEIIRSENGESVLKEIRTSSNLKLEDFRPPDPIKSRKLEAFI